MPSLYLTEQGAKLSKQSQRLIVEKDGEKVLDVPLIKLESVLIYGNIQLTTQAMRLLLEAGVDTAFFTMNGKFIGMLSPVKSKNIPLRMEQYRKAHDETFSLTLAKNTVFAKLKNAEAVLKGYVKNHPDDQITACIRQMRTYDQRIERKTRISTLLGIEGIATCAYYKAFRRAFRGELQFEGRNRRPPRDEVNALLSFGYTLVGNELTSLLSGKGFDPYIGFYHGIQYGRPSLGLDILEEFRPAVDRFVMNLANLKILKKDDFERREGGVYLKREPLRKFFSHYEKWMNQPDTRQKSIRDWMKIQAQEMADAILKNREYEPYQMV